MIRYNKIYQKRADDLVKESGFYDFALYVGHYHGSPKEGEDTQDWLAFRPMHDDSIEYTEGLPQFVLVAECGIIWEIDIFGVMEQVYKQDTLTKGRRLYQEYLHKYETGMFASEDDKDFICHLMLLTYDLTEPVISLRDAYIFLQEAKRLSRRLTILKDGNDPYLQMLDR